MKKAKLCLIIIIAFTTTGSLLAFRLKSLGSTSYCFIEAETQPAPGGCIKGITSSTATPYTIFTKIYYTVTSSADGCRNSTTLDCPNVAQLPFGG